MNKKWIFMDNNENQNKWYKNGLKFKCTECGKCCTGAPGYVWITESEMSAMAAALNISLDLFRKKYVRLKDNRYALIEKKNGSQYDCIFLKDKKCQVYTSRPIQCRTYPWWKENLKTEESWRKAAEDCEGIDEEAPLIPFSEIEKLVQINENNKKK